MVLAPTGLTRLLYQTDNSAESLVGILHRHACLSASALADLPAFQLYVAKIIADDAAERARRPNMPGPSNIDVLARSLLGSPFLSDHGKALADQRG
jgi:hypothetical protein